MSIGRNDQCPCGSGKKYKKCCLLTELDSKVTSFDYMMLRDLDNKIGIQIFKYFGENYSQLDDQLYLDELYCGFDSEDIMTEDVEEEYVAACIFGPWVNYHYIPETNNPENKTIAELYYQKHSNKFTQKEKAFFEVISKEQFSLYQIKQVTANNTIRMNDLLRDQEVIIFDKAGASSLTIGQIMYAKIITLDSNSIMVGNYPLTISSNSATDIINMRNKALSRSPRKVTNEMLFDYDGDIREFFLSIIESQLNFKMPKLRNTDGHDMIDITLSYKVNIDNNEILKDLAHLNINETHDDILSYAKFNKDGSIKEVNFPWLIKGNKTHKSWDNTVFAHISIKNTLLEIDVNSAERANKVKQQMKKLLGEKVTFENEIRESIENNLDKPTSKSKPINPDDHPELKEMMDNMIKKHWESWPDQKIPALMNKTPRQAAKTKIGRERLEAMFTHFQEMNNKDDSHFNQPKVDIAMLRKELDME